MLEKDSKKSYFFLNGPALYPPPLLREGLFLRLPLVYS